MHVIYPDGKMLRAGRATLAVLESLGYRRTARLSAVPPMVWAVELGYRLVADHRSFFSRILFRR